MQNTCICTNDVRVDRFVCINARKSRWLLVHKDRMLGICNIVFYLNIDNSHVVNKKTRGKVRKKDEPQFSFSIFECGHGDHVMMWLG